MDSTIGDGWVVGRPDFVVELANPTNSLAEWSSGGQNKQPIAH